MLHPNDPDSYYTSRELVPGDMLDDVNRAKIVVTNYHAFNTLLIDSEQLESGEALDDDFRGMAADEIDRFRREIVERTGDRRAADGLTDPDLLREVMNTVGHPGRLGGSIRCAVSVAMLTEGWAGGTPADISP